MLVRDLVIGGVSVCLSVCLSHARNVSKLMNLGSYGFNRRVTQALLFFDTNYHTVGRMES